MHAAHAFYRILFDLWYNCHVIALDIFPREPLNEDAKIEVKIYHGSNVCMGGGWRLSADIPTPFPCTAHEHDGQLTLFTHDKRAGREIAAAAGWGRDKKEMSSRQKGRIREGKERKRQNRLEYACVRRRRRGKKSLESREEQEVYYYTV